MKLPAHTLVTGFAADASMGSYSLKRKEPRNADSSCLKLAAA